MDRDITAGRVMSVYITFHCCAYLPVYYYIGGKKGHAQERQLLLQHGSIVNTTYLCTFRYLFCSLPFLFTLSIIPWALWLKFSFAILCSLPLLNRITSQYLSFLFYFLKKEKENKREMWHIPIGSQSATWTGHMVVWLSEPANSSIQCRSIEFKTAGHRDSPTLLPCSTTGLELYLNYWL